MKGALASGCAWQQCTLGGRERRRQGQNTHNAADVWRKDRFAFEYKTRGRYIDLRQAYQQLLLYKEDLDNPPILAATDVENFEIHIAFTGYKTRVERFTNADIRTVNSRDLLHLVLTDPEQLRPAARAESVTEEAAERFARVAQLLEQCGFAPSRTRRSS